jgi:lysyl-tRNA synthetase class 2
VNTSGNSPDWRPCASRHAIEARARVLAIIRAFMMDRGVLEVETPVLSQAGSSDPNIGSLATDSVRKRYLRTSPEYALKRLLASGHRHVYELGRVFRAGELGRHHNPEFTMLEWYRSGMGYLDLADEVLELIRACSAGGCDGWEAHRRGYRDLFMERVGLDPYHCSETELAQCAAERGIASGPLDQSQWLDLLFAEVIQPGLPGEAFTIVHDFLPEQAALARIRPGDPPVAERFEVFMGQMELANGYQELTDPDEQLRRFERENRIRKLRGDADAPIDIRLIAALRHGLPESSGVALGIDRMLMSILKLEHIGAVLAFDATRA